ncbi:MAG: hypothetical protein E7263_05405 [Lachnospiraceae bacterium]|nr:hypothetical protein [Lachnospiraceae bacterium]
MKIKLNKLVAYFLTLILSVVGLCHTDIGSIKAMAANKAMANVVLFVDFADTDHSEHTGSLVGECFMEDFQTTIALFDGNSSVNTGMKQYLDTISYGQFQLVNIFPQYDSESDRILPFTVSQNAAEYADHKSSVLLAEVLEQLNASGLLREDADLNDDGMIDNITLVVAHTAVGEDGYDVFVSHKSSVGGAIDVGNLKANNYNLVTESGAYLGLQQSGLLIHEFMHTLGYPDLYKVGASSDSLATPVGLWDVMASNTYRLQYPLAYLRAYYTGWFSIPTIEEDVKGYTIYAPTATDSTTKDRQALILKTEYSDSEFFVVEYRHTDQEYMSTKYDNYVYGSGLIIYRVNTKQEKNMAGSTDLIYVFRPGDYYDSNGNEAGLGDIEKSFLSAESGRTSYGSSDYEATLSEGAITYSDGTNSGIVISNVGSATGDTITFDVSFGDGGESIGGFWNTESEKELSELASLDSCMDNNGNIYLVAGSTVATATGSRNYFDVYNYNRDNGWNQIGSSVSVNGGYHKIVKSGNDIYVACSDYSNTRVNLYKYNNGWEKVFTSSYLADEFDVVCDGGKIYIAYNTPYGSGTSSLYCEAYSSSGNTSYGLADSGQYLCNPSISIHNGVPVVLSRDVFADNKIVAKKYNIASNQWQQLGGELYGDAYCSKVNKDVVYLMKNGDGKGNYDGSHVYSLDLNASQLTWQQLGTNTFTDNSAVPMSMFFHGDVVYITYQNGEVTSQDVYVKTLVNNKWKMVGTKVTRDGILAMSGNIYDQMIYLVYGNKTSGITIKSHQYEEDADGNASGGSGSESGGNTGGNTGDDSGDNTAIPFEAPNINISYRTHIQTYGWEGDVADKRTWKSNGAMSGTSGKAKRLEGINIFVDSATTCEELDLGIQYTTHCQSYGWLPWSADGDMNGTEGEAKRLEAIKIQLTGKHVDYYDVYYRVHAQTYGWLGWAKNGDPAGTAGYGKRLEGIQIVVVKKGEDILNNMGGITSNRPESFLAKEGKSPVVNYPDTSNTNPIVPGAEDVNVAYRIHVQSYGWQAWKYNGGMSGTSGKAKRLEGINIELRNRDCKGDIVYTTHVQSYGWQGQLDNQSTWKKNGQMSGTSGEAKRLEAICINLTGEMNLKYDIYYRVHAQSYGWLGWTKNGAPAGTAGYGKRLEGIQIVLVPKGGDSPSDYKGIKSQNSKAYIEQ